MGGIWRVCGGYITGRYSAEVAFGDPVVYQVGDDGRHQLHNPAYHAVTAVASAQDTGDGFGPGIGFTALYQVNGACFFSCRERQVVSLRYHVKLPALLIAEAETYPVYLKYPADKAIAKSTAPIEQNDIICLHKTRKSDFADAKVGISGEFELIFLPILPGYHLAHRTHTFYGKAYRRTTICQWQILLHRH